MTAFDVSLQVKSNFQGTGIVSPLDGVVQIHEKSEPHPWVLVLKKGSLLCQSLGSPKAQGEDRFQIWHLGRKPSGSEGGGGGLLVGRILVLRRAPGLCDLRVLHESGLRLGIGVSSLS